MASSEHLECSNFIKSVHQKLRNTSITMGVHEAWLQHCENTTNLQKYAVAMQNLAINHWDVNSKKNNNISRVEWTGKFILNYFTEAEILKHRTKEIEIASKIGLNVGGMELENTEKKIKLLDVGSCYNPFKEYNFDVLPIDIAPATNDVYKCDFLSVKLVPSAATFVKGSEIQELQLYSFDVVVFSLVLEYLPSSTQRHLCCVKAYNLLKVEGILIILTPDSKHVGANAKIMKSWRFILAKLGFSRIKYEKLAHLHCMVFRKSLKKEIAVRWASLQDENLFYHEIVIPQDFKQTENLIIRTESLDSCDISLFNELPFVNYE